MGFGLCNALAAFSRAMQSVLHGLLWGDVLSLDDVIVLGLNFEVHLTNLAKVFQRLRQHNLKLKPRKCFLFREEVKFFVQNCESKTDRSATHSLPDRFGVNSVNLMLNPVKQPRSVSLLIPKT